MDGIDNTILAYDAASDSVKNAYGWKSGQIF